MKKGFNVFCLAAALSASMAVPAFAAEDQETFRTEADSLYEQMQELNAQINPLREENNTISQKYKEICAARKAGGELPTDEETWDEIKALRSEISQYQSAKADTSVKAKRTEAKTAADAGDYDGALSIMEEVIAAKQERLANVQAANALWLQIQELLGE